MGLQKDHYIADFFLSLPGFAIMARLFSATPCRPVALAEDGAGEMFFCKVGCGVVALWEIVNILSGGEGGLQSYR